MVFAILLLSAPLKEVIWGGNYFKDVLNVTTSDEKIGEMWSCSAHKNGQSIIKNGCFKGKTLEYVYKNHKELFDNSSLDEFPILVKLIATTDKLSVQVHPNDEYALKYENQYGKTEGWLILDENENSEIVIGHNAKNKEELIEYINNDDYDGLLRKKVVKTGEFYPIPSGTIHALGANIVLLEIQQSSDVTYRFYDYHRKDAMGNERPLHINKAVEVTARAYFIVGGEKVFLKATTRSLESAVTDYLSGLVELTEAQEEAVAALAAYLGIGNN